MKITRRAWATPVLYSVDSSGNPILSNPDDPVTVDPVDVALGADAFVPIEGSATAGIVQSKSVQYITPTTDDRLITLDATPTPGNILVLIHSSRSTESNTILGPLGWNAHADSPVYAGNAIGGAEACPTAMFWHVVETGDGATVTSRTTSDPNATVMTLVELAGVATLIDSPSLDHQHDDNPKLTGSIGANDAILIVGAHVQQDGTPLVYTPDSGTTEVYDESIGGDSWPHQWVGYRVIESGSGSYDVGATGLFALDWGALGLAFDHAGVGVSQQVAPFVTDGDDATYNESGLEEVVRLDIGTEQRLASARLLIGIETSGSRTYELWAGNAADLSDAVLVATDTTVVSATPGGGTTGTLVPATAGALAAAVAAASPGDTLRLRGGDHLVDDIIYVNKELTITNYTGERPNITHPTARPEFLFFTGGPILIDGLVFTGVGGYGDVHGSALVSMQDGSHDVTIQNCEFHGASNMGATQQLIYHHDTSGTGASILNCLIDGHGSGGFGVHLYPGPGPDDVLVQYNTIRNFPAKSGVVVWTDSSGIEILDNAFSHCGSAVRHHNSGGTNVDGNIGTDVGSGLEVDDATNLTVGTNDWSSSETFPATGSYSPDELLYTISDPTAYRYWEFRGPGENTRTYTVELFAYATTTDLTGYQLLSEKGFPDGYAGLDSSSKVPTAQLPDVENLATMELDDSLVLAPDGAGGLEFRAETGGSGTPADTVSDETTFGISPDAGAATEYSRGDHTHGTPTDPGSGGMTNPMTTAGDLIVGDTGGTPDRLAKGSDGDVLTVDPTTHLLVWAAPSPAADITDIPTAETDTALVLHPDGVGGVEWGTDATGGGGGGTSLADTPPASPNASDDEFDVTDTSDPLTGWTTLQTPTAHDINSTFPGNYRVKMNATGSSTGHVGIYKAWTPSNGDTITCKVTDYFQSGVNYQRGCQLFICEASPGKMILIQYVQDSSGPRLATNYYTGPGTYSGGIDVVGSTWLLGGAPFYFRVRYNTSTSIDYLWSKNGLIYSPITIAHNPGFTPGAFGISIEPAQGTYDGEAAFDWVRKNWTPGT